jgi:hypothetical protein
MGGQIVGERGSPFERDFHGLGLFIGIANAQRYTHCAVQPKKPEN